MPRDAAGAARARRPMSLALRVTLLVGLATTALFIAGAWAVELAVARHFAQMDDADLRAAWPPLQRALRHGADALLRDAAEQGLVAAVRDADGRVLASSAQAELAAWKPAVDDAGAGDGAVVWVGARHVYRVALLRDGDIAVVVAKPIDFHWTFQQELNQALWAGTLLASLISVLAARLAVAQGHVPLRRVVGRIRATTAERLDARLDPEQVPTELRDLVDAFNAMLERIDAAFRRLSHVSADVAHELRTPLTNLITQTQVGLSRARDAQAYRELLYSNLEEFERMRAMIGDMLLLARIGQGAMQPQPGGVDLAAEARALFDYFEAWAEERGVVLRLQGTAQAAAGDRALLRRALSNLLANAIAHTAAGAAVEVRLGEQAGRCRVDVRNPGPDLAPEHLPRLFDRFYRVDPARQRDGAGLGLAIVQSIAELHGGSVAVASRDGTTVFTLMLPAVPRG